MENFVKSALNKHREGILYLICGGIVVLLTWTVYSVLVNGGTEKNVSNIVSWVCGVLFAFVPNKLIVFSNRTLKPEIVARELGSFIGSRIFTGTLAIIMFPLLYGIGLNHSIFGTDGLAAKIAVTAVEIVLNWTFSKYLVFR